MSAVPRELMDRYNSMTTDLLEEVHWEYTESGKQSAGVWPMYTRKQFNFPDSVLHDSTLCPENTSSQDSTCRVRASAGSW